MHNVLAPPASRRTDLDNRAPVIDFLFYVLFGPRPEPEQRAKPVYRASAAVGPLKVEASGPDLVETLKLFGGVAAITTLGVMAVRSADAENKRIAARESRVDRFAQKLIEAEMRRLPKPRRR